MSKSFEDMKADLLRDPAVRAEYDARAEEFEIARELISARQRAAPSQDLSAAARVPVRG